MVDRRVRPGSATLATTLRHIRCSCPGSAGWGGGAAAAAAGAGTRPLRGGLPFGAAVEGLDLRRLTPADVVHLREELRTRGLVLLRGQRLQGAEFAEAMRRLQSAEPSGSIERMITYETTPTNPEDDCADPAAARVPKAHLAGLPHVRRLGNAAAGGRREALLSHTPYDWHTDSIGAWQTALFCPPGGALSSGGETLVCSSAAAYDALSPAQRKRAESLTAVFSNRFTGGSPSAYDFLHGLRLNASGTAVVREASSRRPSWQLSESRTPFVRRHSQTGKPDARGFG